MAEPKWKKPRPVDADEPCPMGFSRGGDLPEYRRRSIDYGV